MLPEASRRGARREGVAVDVRLIAKVLRMRSRIGKHERWSRDEIHAHQQQAFAALRAHALRHSRFYQRHYHRRETAPLQELPVVTKRDLMGNFDEFVTDPKVTLRISKTYLTALSGNCRVLQLPSLAGSAISVHPNVFHRVMEPLPVREWQVVQERDRLRVLLVESRADVVLDHVHRDLDHSLRSAGIAPPQITLELAASVTRTPLGKAPLVRRYVST